MKNVIFLFLMLSVGVLYGQNVGIGTTTPSEKLEVAGSIKIVDGTQGAGKVLVSDATGKGTWKNVAQYIVKGTIPAPDTTAAVLDATDTGAIAYTGCSIDLPAGSWLIKATTWLAADGTDTIAGFNNLAFASIFLSTSPTMNTPPTYESNIKSIIINPLYQPGHFYVDFYGTGEIPISLTSPQTIYLWGYIHKGAWKSLDATPDSVKASIISRNNAPGNYGPYTQLYAVPINISN